MSEEPDDRHITRGELRLELRSFKNEVRLLMAVAVLVIKFQVPTEVTAGVVGAIVLKTLAGLVYHH